jgi:hypothetical protein
VWIPTLCRLECNYQEPVFDRPLARTQKTTPEEKAMTKSTESSTERRKLLDEIRRLADIAVFGTLSETYRTCGRAGCHCQSGGSKHGPHLNISYRGEKGKTTGYYVPQGAEKATREGVAAWQKLLICLRELAELNKERNLRQAREGDSR